MWSDPMERRLDIRNRRVGPRHRSLTLRSSGGNIIHRESADQQNLRRDGSEPNYLLKINKYINQYFRFDGSKAHVGVVYILFIIPSLLRHQSSTSCFSPCPTLGKRTDFSPALALIRSETSPCFWSSCSSHSVWGKTYRLTGLHLYTEHRSENCPHDPKPAVTDTGPVLLFLRSKRSCSFFFSCFSRSVWEKNNQRITGEEKAKPRGCHIPPRRVT